MKVSEISAPQVHDLLQIDAHALTADSVSRPQWVTKTLICCPWVVVRRGQAPAGKVSVGVRRAARSERWGWVLQQDPNKEDSSAGGVAGAQLDLSTSSSDPCIAGSGGGHRKVAKPQLAVGTDGQRWI